MRKLYINGNPSEFYFTDSSTIETIANWVRYTAYAEGNALGLKEPYLLDIYVEEPNRICIRGDEDVWYDEFQEIV